MSSKFFSSFKQFGISGSSVDCKILNVLTRVSPDETEYWLVEAGSLA